MKIYFRKVTCTLLALCLATTGCAYGQQWGTVKAIPEATLEETPPEEVPEIIATEIPPEEVSEIVAIEAIPVPMPTNITIGDDWCYIRFSLTRERLEKLADDANDTTLSLTGVAPNDDAFYINVTHEDVVQSLQFLDDNPGQQAINLVKPLPSSAVNGFGDEPEDNYYYVYYLLTVDDVQRMLSTLQSTNGDVFILRQRLDLSSDSIAEFHLESSALVKCLEVLSSTDQTYIPYICYLIRPGIEVPSANQPTTPANVL